MPTQSLQCCDAVVISDMQSFLNALSFLTIIKVPNRLLNGDFSKSAYSFAFVGLFIGCGLAMVHVIVEPVAPFFMLLYLGIITGFLHIDGLADTFDALFSSRTKEKMLEIMKDSRIGSMGAAGIILCFAGKFYAFTMIEALIFMVLIPAFSRFAMIILLNRMPNAREGGMGSTFNVKYRVTVYLQIVPVLLLAVLFCGLLKTGMLLAAFLLIYTLVEIWYKRKIGGITGDMCGALCEIMETGLFLTVAAFPV